ncbi:MAG: hypothetical protein WDN06_04635 [Asticcacaulis sp.]
MQVDTIALHEGRLRRCPQRHAARVGPISTTAGAQVDAIMLSDKGDAGTGQTRRRAR